MTKSTILALVATLGLSVSASAYQSIAMSQNASTAVSGVFAPSVNSVMKGVDSLLDSTLRETSEKATALSYNASTTLYNSTVKVANGVWTVSTNTSAAVTAPIFKAVKNSANTVSKTAVYKSVAGFSADVITSDAAINSRNSIENITSAYGEASGQAASFVWESTKTGLTMSVRATAKSVDNVVVLTVNGSKATAGWSRNDVSAADDKSAAPLALSRFVSAKFVDAIKSSANASHDFLFHTDWAKSGLTVSIVNASGTAVAGSKAVAGAMWVVVTAGSTNAYDFISEGEYSQASEVLLMLPLNSVKGASAVSTSTKKDDELGEGDIPDTKKKGN